MIGEISSSEKSMKEWLDPDDPDGLRKRIKELEEEIKETRKCLEGEEQIRFGNPHEPEPGRLPIIGDAAQRMALRRDSGLDTMLEELDRLKRKLSEIESSKTES